MAAAVVRLVRTAGLPVLRQLRLEEALLRAVEARWIAEGFPDAGRVQALLDEALTAEKSGAAEKP